MSPVATKSNSSAQASYVVAIASAASDGSPGVPMLVLERKLSGPMACTALPVVRIMPLSIVIGVLFETNVPLAAFAQVSTGLSIVIPGPANFDDSVAAVLVGLTVSWA